MISTTPQVIIETAGSARTIGQASRKKYRNLEKRCAVRACRQRMFTCRIHRQSGPSYTPSPQSKPSKDRQSGYDLVSLGPTSHSDRHSATTGDLGLLYAACVVRENRDRLCLSSEHMLNDISVRTARAYSDQDVSDGARTGNRQWPPQLGPQYFWDI